jgi:hypothetical protein
MAVQFRWLTRGNTILENWQVIHFRLLGNDAYLPYGSSVLEPARRIWRQLILIEDAMLVYRIVRSPERRVFHIEIANTPPDQVDTFIEQVKTQMKRNTIVDSGDGPRRPPLQPALGGGGLLPPEAGRAEVRDRHPAGGQFTGDIEDVQYIQSKMFAAIKIPRAYLGYEDQLGSKATLAQEDVRFSKTIERIQSLFVAELNKIAIIHLFLLGYSGQDLKNFEIKMANPSTVAEQQRLELWRMKLEVAGMAQEGMFDRGFIHRKIFGLNDKQIAAIKDGKRIDKLEDALLQSIQARRRREVRRQRLRQSPDRHRRRARPPAPRSSRTHWGVPRPRHPHRPRRRRRQASSAMATGSLRRRTWARRGSGRESPWTRARTSSQRGGPVPAQLRDQEADRLGPERPSRRPSHDHPAVLRGVGRDARGGRD